MRKSVLNTALSTAFIVALGFGISACSGDKEGEHGSRSHEVMAVDRVDEAAELARANAPEAEKMDFPETAPMPAAEGDAAVDGTATADGTAADATTTDAATAEATTAGNDTAETPATDSTTAGVVGTDSTDTAATSGTAAQ